MFNREENNKNVLIVIAGNLHLKKLCVLELQQKGVAPTMFFTGNAGQFSLV